MIFRIKKQHETNDVTTRYLALMEEKKLLKDKKFYNERFDNERKK